MGNDRLKVHNGHAAGTLARMLERSNVYKVDGVPTAADMIRLMHLMDPVFRVQ